MRKSRSIALLILLGLGGCVVYPDGYPVLEMPAPQTEVGQNRDILVTTWQGSKESLVMRRGKSGVKAGFVRVCLQNNTKGVRTLVHRIPNINNLETTGSGLESCANFPANITLNLTAKAAGRAAALNNADSIRLADFSGYHLWFIWG